MEASEDGIRLASRNSFVCVCVGFVRHEFPEWWIPDAGTEIGLELPTASFQRNLIQ